VPEPVITDVFSSPLVTYRRLWLDRLLEFHAAEMQGYVIDVGGKRHNKRGQFSPPHKNAKAWVYVNLDIDTQPDLFADVSTLPISNQSADVVICTEVLEHLANPVTCSTEIVRILKPGGIAFVSVPFMYPIHADPYDFQRFTDDGLKHLFKTCSTMKIWPMGGFLGVLGMFLEIGVSGIQGKSLHTKILRRALTQLARQLCARDLAMKNKQPVAWQKFTTGYFMRVIK
jgi:SAM-dependent methyltransferase